MCQFFCCQSRACSICCTIWCLFGFVFTGFFGILMDMDQPYASVDIVGDNQTEQAADVFTGSAIIYAVCAVICGFFWIYHDFIKKKKMVTRKYTTEASEVELQTRLLNEDGGGGGKPSDPVEL